MMYVCVYCGVDFGISVEVIPVCERSIRHYFFLVKSTRRVLIKRGTGFAILALAIIMC